MRWIEDILCLTGIVVLLAIGWVACDILSHDWRIGFLP